MDLTTPRVRGFFFLNLATGFIHLFVFTAINFFPPKIGHFFAQHYITFPILRISFRVYVRIRESKK